MLLGYCRTAWEPDADDFHEEHKIFRASAPVRIVSSLPFGERGQGAESSPAAPGAPATQIQAQADANTHAAARGRL